MLKSLFHIRILIVIFFVFFIATTFQNSYAQKSLEALQADSLFQQGKYKEAALAFHDIAQMWQSQNLMDSVNLYQLWEVNSYMQLYEYDKCKDILHEILSRESILKDSALLSRVYYQLAFANVNDGHYQEAETFAEKSVQVEENRAATDTFRLAKYYEIRGFTSMQMDNYEAAKKLTTQAYLLRKKISDPMDKELGYSANTLYMVLSNLGELKSADTVIREAWTILKENLPEDHPHIAAIANNYSNHLQAMGEPQKAKDFLIAAIASNQKGKRDYPLMDNYLNLGSLYLILNDNNTAETYLRQALAIADSIVEYPDFHHANTQDALGAVLYKTSRLDEAENLFKAALQEKRDLYGSEHSEIAQSFYNLGLIAKERENWIAAADYFNKSEKIRTDVLGVSHPARADALFEIAEIAWATHKKPEAIRIWKNCYEIYRENLGLSHLNSLETLVRLARAMDEMHQPDSTQQYLKLAWGSSCKLMSQLPDYAILDTLSINNYNTRVLLLANLHLNIIRSQGNAIPIEDFATARYIFKAIHRWLPAFLSLFEDATVWETIANDVQDFYRQSAILAHKALLTPGTNQEAWEGILLSCIQSSRGATIQAALRERQAIQFAGVPDSLVEKGQMLRQQIQFTFARQQDAKEGENTLQITEQQLSLLQEWEELQQYLKKDYPRYYQARFEIPSVDETALQQHLHENGFSMLAYFNLDLALLAVHIKDESIQSIWLNMPEGWQDSLQTYQKMLLQRTADQHLAELGFYLYQYLWEPLHIAQQSHVKILADGPLYYFNFETLLTQRSFEHASLAKWPWLIRDYFIYYGHTLPLTELQTATNGKILGIAPGFSQELKNDYLKNLPPNQSPDSVFLHWVRTPWSSSFVEQLQEKGWGSALTALNATETAFLQEAPTANILHFGTHARLENDRPLYSFLALTPNPASEQDGYLYTYELYNEPLQAQLAVLTACETGLGMYRRGEGVLSLAHAFRYAGCPSVIYSLWEIDDEQSNQISAGFYDNLKDGMTLAEALRTAKLSYLDNAESNFQFPYYWAGLILTGEDQEVKIGASWHFFKISGIALGVLLIPFVFAFFLARRNRKS